MLAPKKLIEVALPLEAINEASAREKAIRHGHPSTLHLWWARRPLAAARAVIFAQMVDDPSAWPDLFKNEKEQEKERTKLLRIIEDLVQWENTTNEEVLQKARDAIWESWRRTCAANADHPRANELFDRSKLPAFHDPFAGGGGLPLEAQRLGLEAYASDLNPVAVLINKAMIEIPPRFAGRPPVNPEARANKDLIGREWKGAKGLAEDLRYYGNWMRDEAERRIGHLYPKVEVTADVAKGRPDLRPYVGRKLTVIAWIWARTVKSPNPAFAKVAVPLATTFMLSVKAGKEAYVQPIIDGEDYHFSVQGGKPKDAALAHGGTKLSRGANFQCLMSGAPISAEHIKAEARGGRLGARMMAIVAEGERGRVYLPPTREHEAVAASAKPRWLPEGALVADARAFTPTLYGLMQWSDLFTSRQLEMLSTFSELVTEAAELVVRDADAAGITEGRAYADAVSVYLAALLSRLLDLNNALCQWRNDPAKQHVGHMFARQAVPMVWDFAEANPLGQSAGGFDKTFSFIPKALGFLPCAGSGTAVMLDAQTQGISATRVVSTDPPYYDNVPYADLSDFFYVWLRRPLRMAFPELFGTLAAPKDEELVVTPYRHGGRTSAQAFFMEGMTNAIHRLSQQAHPALPVTIYYAFKQSETESDADGPSSGWETFLDAVIGAGFGVTGTWPLRTELGNRMRSMASNALASSIVLVCRARPADAPTATRREFVTALKKALPPALARLQKENIAPVDLAQSAIGPGMAVFTRYSKVIDAAGNALTVREALALINQVLDEALSEQEGDFEPDSRYALAWFEQYGFAEGEYGVAETLSKAKDTSVAGMVEAGMLVSGKGKVRLLKPAELPTDWDPETDNRLTTWETVHHLIRVLESGGEAAAAAVMKKLGARAETARELCYRLYTLCERKKRAQEALSYNALVQSWPEIARLAQEGAKAAPKEKELFEQEGDE